MPVSPTTGQIITTAGLGINQVDALQLPRNAQLGPSRTAQERKQLRTMMYQQRLAVNELIDDEIVNNPLIEELVEAVDTLQLFQPRTFTLVDQAAAPTITLADIPIERVEDTLLDPYYYGFIGKFQMAVTPGNGDFLVELEFPGTTQYHAVSAFLTRTTTAQPYATSGFLSTEGTDEEISFNFGDLDTNTQQVSVIISGKIACISESGAIRIRFTCDGDSTTESIDLPENSVFTIQLTEQTFNP